MLFRSPMYGTINTQTYVAGALIAIIIIIGLVLIFAKENEKFQLKCAYINGKVFADDVIKKLAAMPPKEVLIARLVSILNSPISGMVTVLSGITKKYVYVINAIKEQKEKQGGK